MADGNYVRVTRLGEYPEHLVSAVRSAAVSMFDPDIAESLGLSLCQVRNIRKKHDIPARVPPDRWTPDRDARLLDLYIVQGLQAKDVGKALGVSEGAIRARAKSLGVRRDPMIRRAKPPPPPKPKKAAPPPPPVNTTPEAAFMALPRTMPVAFLARSSSGCRWPIDGADDEPWCCNQPITAKHPSYCEAHRIVARDGWPRGAQCSV